MLCQEAPTNRKALSDTYIDISTDNHAENHRESTRQIQRIGEGKTKDEPTKNTLSRLR